MNCCHIFHVDRLLFSNFLISEKAYKVKDMVIMMGMMIRLEVALSIYVHFFIEDHIAVKG